MLDLLKKLFSGKPATEAVEKTTVAAVPLTTQYTNTETKPAAKKKTVAKKKPTAGKNKKTTKQS